MTHINTAVWRERELSYNDSHQHCSWMGRELSYITMTHINTVVGWGGSYHTMTHINTVVWRGRELSYNDSHQHCSVEGEGAIIQ